ncbi:Helix-turn-helix, type 11 domain protein [Alkaliphilus metalliredigens QYMF]|uniref:Helix-turn-helix, type 11 domain protein n=1 Tax=Alkaliphilus metalliredigens (strain QYMF) TaxID=293826 RepID=A6TQ78_ALKMQ|nr:WYL domain-containing transcriptional regulator [Alkaliphilus metalliredigens]ABR48346.1 Helix-turn-helix, type 11 domain protein [Alkaliphilus metalliredigens QYMF]
MSKVSNALNMYFLLQVRGAMRVKEIAEALEVTPRMVKKYKQDLEMAGIYVGSKLGRAGGYYLENKRRLDAIGLTEEELITLKMANKTIQSGKYHYQSRFETTVNKILNCNQHTEEINYHNKSMRESDEILKKEKHTWVDINIAVNQNRRASIKYKSLKKHGIEIRERLVNPYGIFDYKGATYFYGYCDTAKDIRFFKLSRVIEYRVLDEKFTGNTDFNFDKVLEKSFGIYNDEFIDLKLNISYPMSEIVKEKQIAKDQRITEIDEKTICFEAKIKGYAEIKTWVMSLGSSAEVIQPSKLKEEIIAEAHKMTKIYQ